MSSIILLATIAVGVFIGHMSSLLLVGYLAALKQRKALSDLEEQLGLNRDEDKKIKRQFSGERNGTIH